MSSSPAVSRIPDQNFFHPGSRIQGQKDFRFPRIRRIKEFRYLTQKIVSKFSEILSGMFIPDPDLDFLPSRIPDPGVKKAPDQDPQHCFPGCNPYLNGFCLAFLVQTLAQLKV
jgi:hypothetical protein